PKHSGAVVPGMQLESIESVSQEKYTPSVPSQARVKISLVHSITPRATSSCMGIKRTSLSTKKSCQSFGLSPLREPICTMFLALQFGRSSARDGPEQL